MKSLLLEGENFHVSSYKLELVTSPLHKLRYTEDAGLPYFDCATVIANGTWLCGSALKSMGAKLCFRSCLINIGPSYT